MNWGSKSVSVEDWIKTLSASIVAPSTRDIDFDILDEAEPVRGMADDLDVGSRQPSALDIDAQILTVDEEIAAERVRETGQRIPEDLEQVADELIDGLEDELPNQSYITAGCGKLFEIEVEGQILVVGDDVDVATAMNAARLDVRQHVRLGEVLAACPSR